MKLQIQHKEIEVSQQIEEKKENEAFNMPQLFLHEIHNQKKEELFEFPPLMTNEDRIQFWNYRQRQNLIEFSERDALTRNSTTMAQFIEFSQGNTSKEEQETTSEEPHYFLPEISHFMSCVPKANCLEPHQNFDDLSTSMQRCISHLRKYIASTASTAGFEGIDTSALENFSDLCVEYLHTICQKIKLNLDSKEPKTVLIENSIHDIDLLLNKKSLIVTNKLYNNLFPSSLIPNRNFETKSKIPNESEGPIISTETNQVINLFLNFFRKKKIILFKLSPFR